MNISVRKANINDCLDIYKWRNNSIVRKESFNTEKINLNEHIKWFNNKLKSNLCCIYIFVFEEKKIGVIRFDKNYINILVSVMLNPCYLGKKLGSVIIKLGTEKYTENNKDIYKLTAEVKRTNIISVKAFLKAGYHIVSEMETKILLEYDR